MIKKLAIFTLLLLPLVPVLAQLPEEITAFPAPPSKEKSKLACNNFAGTVSVGASAAQSNDLKLDTLFLCFGDSVLINVNGANLSSDPQPGTPAGLGLGFYRGRPNVSGPTIGDINGDINAVLGTNDTIRVVGPFTGPGPNATFLFTNTGFLQNTFNGGAPGIFWFAPMTLDLLTPRLGHEKATNGEECVNVNIDEAFAVVYLNQIQISDFTTNGSDCRGMFRVRGGYPEVANRPYKISIVSTTDPNDRGNVLSTPNHDSFVEFTVPKSGDYTITVEDGISCSSSIGVTIDQLTCKDVIINIPVISALPGDKVCLDVTVEQFTLVGALQFSLNWDINVLQYDTIRNFNNTIPGFDLNTVNESTAKDGNLILSWFDPVSNSNITLPDSAVLFQLCFNVIGQIGDASPVVLSNTPRPIEIGDSNANRYGLIHNDGRVVVTTDVLLPVYTVKDSIFCPGNFETASIKVQSFGGEPPYRMTWERIAPVPIPQSLPIVLSKAGDAFTIDNLTGGTYIINITDNDSPSNSIFDTITIFEAPTLGVRVVDTQPLCFRDLNGRVEAQVLLDGVRIDNPEENYSFRWNTTNQDTSVLFGLAGGGRYSVTITDQNGCTADAATTLSQPAPIRIDRTLTPATCNGAEDGTIDLRISGGTPNNGSYALTYGGFTLNTANQVITGVDPGTYHFTVTDANNCQVVDSVILSANKIIAIDPLNIQDIICNSAATGSISLAGTTTGAPLSEPYIFTWQGIPSNASETSTATTSTVSGLPAGTYTVEMSDSDPSGCRTDPVTFTLTEPQPILAQVASLKNESCDTGNDGSISVSVNGGVSPYTYVWSSGQTDSLITGLSAGSFTLSITDANNCIFTLDTVITLPTPPQITQLQDAFVSCPNSKDGSLSVTATPSGAPITGYEWRDSLGNIVATTPNAANLAVGAYTVRVTAQDQCVVIDTANVFSPGPVVVDNIVITPPSCPSFADGRIAVLVQGGTRPYSYKWSHNSTVTDTFALEPALKAGTYSVTITDANNCTPLIIDNILLEDPARVVITFDTTSIIPVNCFASTSCDGSVTASASYSDNTPGQFTFNWASESGTGPVMTATQLCRGFNTLTVTDAKGCPAVDSINIPSPPEIILNSDVTPVTCNGLTDGSVEVSASGGVPGFSIEWLENGSTSFVLSDLAPGDYNAVVIDANGCTKTQRITIAEPDQLELSIDDLNSALFLSCGGINDGKIAVVYNDQDNINPVGDMPFTWSNGIGSPSSNIASNLAVGTYSVIITDLKGCQDSVNNITISEPPPVIAIIREPEAPKCFGEPTQIVIDTAFGGSGQSLDDYTYVINRNQLNFPLNQPASVFAGQQIVTVLDPRGCFFEDTLTIPQPDPIEVLFDPGMVTVDLGDSATLFPIINSSLPIDSFIWKPGDELFVPSVETPLIKPTDSRQYTLTVVDANGCRQEGKVFVEVDRSRNVFIPNIFSPEGGGPNDDFRIFTCSGVRNVKSVLLFDRWGSIMYEATNLAPQCEGGIKLWDGKQAGKPLNQGAYVYVIEVEFIDDVTLIYRGDVVLIR